MGILKTAIMLMLATTLAVGVLHAQSADATSSASTQKAQDAASSASTKEQTSAVAQGARPVLSCHARCAPVGTKRKYV